MAETISEIFYVIKSSPASTINDTRLAPSKGGTVEKCKRAVLKPLVLCALPDNKQYKSLQTGYSHSRMKAFTVYYRPIVKS